EGLELAVAVDETPGSHPPAVELWIPGIKVPPWALTVSMRVRAESEADAVVADVDVVGIPDWSRRVGGGPSSSSSRDGTTRTVVTRPSRTTRPSVTSDNTVTPVGA